MKKVLIFHGLVSHAEQKDKEYPSPSNNHWYPWLQKQLIMNGIHSQTPELPNPHAPAYETWKTELERYEIDDETILVGHSRGAAMLNRYFHEHPDQSAAKVVLVSPSITQPPSDNSDMFEYTASEDAFRAVGELHLFTSNNDFDFSLESAQILRERHTDIIVHDIEGMGHYIADTPGHMESVEFNGLLEVLLP